MFPFLIIIDISRLILLTHRLVLSIQETGVSLKGCLTSQPAKNKYWQKKKKAIPRTDILEIKMCSFKSA